MSIFNNQAAEILMLLFFIITYFFSAFEKIIDWKGTVSYYKTHFKSTILAKYMSLILFNIVLLELLVFVLLIIGTYLFINQQNPLIAKIALELSALILLIFLSGQRMVKDYAGAMNIAVYFILNCFALFILT